MLIPKNQGNYLIWDDAFTVQVAEPVDCVIIDPPYMVKSSAKGMAPVVRPDGSGFFDGVTEEWDATATTREEHLHFIKQYVQKVKESVKEDGTAWIFGQYHNIHDVGHEILNSGGFILNEIVWVVANPAPQFRGVRFCNSIQNILWYRPSGKGKYYFDYHGLKTENGGKQQRADWYAPVCSGSERLRMDDPTTRSGKAVVHQTQKPLSIIERMIKASTRPDETVFDFFGGVGTTGVAAHNLGRRFLLIEKEFRYVQATIKRFEDANIDPETYHVLIPTPIA